MKGPFQLDRVNVGRLPAEPGIFLLSGDRFGTIVVMYVGRGASLRRQLGHWVGKYSHFFYKSAKTEERAFDMECTEFHRYGGLLHLENEAHPEIPVGSSLPRCSDKECTG